MIPGLNPGISFRHEISSNVQRTRTRSPLFSIGTGNKGRGTRQVSDPCTVPGFESLRQFDGIGCRVPGGNDIE